MMFLERLQELGLSAEVLALARGMLFGDKSVIDPALVHDFRTSGMSHLLAVSGLHVGVIMSIVWLLLRPAEILCYHLSSHWLKVYYATGTIKRIIVMVVTVLYVWLIGAPTSAVRAALMLCLCQMGWLLRRPTSAMHCLMLTALILLAIDPWNITQVGFQLSFLAVLGILLFQPWLQDHEYRWWERLVLLSISAQWLTVPLVAYYFHQVPFLGWLQGLLVVPLIPCFIGGLLLGACFPAFHCLCLPLETLYGWFSWVSKQIGHWESLLIGGHLYFYPSLIETIVAEIALLALVAWFHLSRIRKQKSEQILIP